jgi:hypothetical protein
MSANQLDPMHSELRRAQAVQDRYSAMLMSKPHVVGLAIGYTSTPDLDATADERLTAQAPARDSRRQVCIVVMVDEPILNDTLPDAARIPDELDGFPVVIQPTGMFTAGFAAG